MLLAQDNLVEASQAYERKRDIISRLAAADPSNVFWQRDLSVSHNIRDTANFNITVHIKLRVSDTYFGLDTPAATSCSIAAIL